MEEALQAIFITPFPLSFSAVSVESTGALPSDVLVLEAIKVLRNKCDKLRLFIAANPQAQRHSEF